MLSYSANTEEGGSVLNDGTAKNCARAKCVAGLVDLIQAVSIGDQVVKAKLAFSMPSEIHPKVPPGNCGAYATSVLPLPREKQTWIYGHFWSGNAD